MENLIANLHNWCADWLNAPEIRITEFKYEGDARSRGHGDPITTMGQVRLQLLIRDDYNSYLPDEQGLPRHVQEWRIDCENVIDCTLSMSDLIDSITVSNDHPRLWRYIEPTSELFFRGESRDVLQLLADWSGTHDELCGWGFPLSEVVGPIHHLVKKLNGRFGSLGAVPLPLAEPYAACLRRHGLQCSILPPRPQANSTDHLGDGPYRAVLMNDRWLIGEGIRVEQISGPSPQERAVDFEPRHWDAGDF